MRAGALVAATSVAAAAGVGAVALASGTLAAVGGVASVVSALLALDGGLARERVTVAEAAQGMSEIDAFLAGSLAEVGVSDVLRARLDAARQTLRPVALVWFEAFELDAGRPAEPVDAEEITRVLGRTLRDADVAGRAGPGTYACILDDTGEDGAVWTAERVRRKLADGAPARRFRAGVAAYPTHALDADELEAAARAALDGARDWDADRIEVAGA